MHVVRLWWVGLACGPHLNSCGSACLQGAHFPPQRSGLTPIRPTGQGRLIHRPPNLRHLGKAGKMLGIRRVAKVMSRDCGLVNVTQPHRVK